jgi:hypothetical protein
MIARAKRRGLRLSFRAIEPREAGMFELRFMDGVVECLMLALLQRLAAAGCPDRKVGRSDVSRPPERDPRQTSLF